MEGQVARYKTAAENAERIEDELKAEKRKLQREVTLNANSQGLAGSLHCLGKLVYLVRFRGGTTLLGRAKNKRRVYCLIHSRCLATLLALKLE